MLHFNAKLLGSFIVLLFSLCAVSTFAQTTYTWNGSVSTSWTTAANWTPSTGTPGATDHVIIVSSANTPTLAASAAVTNFTMTSGSLNLGGFTLTSTGTQTFTAGTISNGTFSVGSGSATTFTNTTFSANLTLDVLSAGITLNGGTFNGTTTLHHNGATNSGGNGNATFNGTTVFKTSGAGYFRQNGNMTFNGPTQFIVSGGGYLLPELSGNNTYNNSLRLTIEATATNNLRMVYNGSSVFNGNIQLENLSAGQYIQFCEQAVSTATLSTGNTITAGPLGFTGGRVQLFRFTQQGNTAQNLAMTGTAYVQIDGNTTFNGDLTVTAPTLTVQNSTFQRSFTFNKTGTTNDQSAGGNVFNGVFTINVQNTGYFMISNNASNTFNDHVVVSTSSTGNIYLGFNTSAAWSLAAGKTITIGAPGFADGMLYIRGLNQLGGTAQTLAFTGIAQFQMYNSNLTGVWDVTAARVYIGANTFNSDLTLTKTGAGSDASPGGNTFNGTSTFNNGGSGYLMMGNGTVDIYNGDVYTNNYGTERIIMAYNSIGNQFNGNIIATQTGTGNNTTFGYPGTTATAILASGKTFTIGAAGYNTGTLTFNNFTQLGSTAQNVALTGSGRIQISGACTFNAVWNFSAPDIYVQGGTFQDDVTFTKTGGTDNHNNGVLNIFNGTTNINNQSSAYFMLGYNSADQFNDDIYVSNTGTGGIRLGYNAGTGTPVLAAGKTIFVGAGGFSNGYLRLDNFTQLGNAPINLTFTGVSTFLVYGINTTLGGDVTSLTPGVYFHGTTFNGNVIAEKNGAADNAGNGGNIFNGTANISNSGSGYLMLGNGSPDVFHGDAVFSCSGTNNLWLGYNSTGNTFNGNVTFNNTSAANGIYIARDGINTAFNGNIIVNATAGAGIQFCNNNGNVTLAAGKTISTSTGFSAGTLLLRRFTQVGGTPQSLLLTGTSVLQFGPTSSFGGNVTSTSASLLFNGCTFSGTTTCTKNGAPNDNSSGGNIFTGVSLMTNNGSGQLLFGNGSSDQFLSDATFINNGSNHIYVAHNSAGNVFNGVTTFTNNSSTTGIIYISNYSANTQFNNNILVNSTAGNGVYFCANGGSVTLNAGRTISVGASGFTTGTLYLRNFTQVGATAQSLLLTGTGRLEYGPLANFGGDVVSTSARLFFTTSTFAGTTNCSKTGASDDYSGGGNTFTGDAILTNSGSGFIVMSNGNFDTYGANVTYNNTGTSTIYASHNSVGNTIAGNVTVNNSATGGTNVGVRFCESTNATLTIGGNVSVTNNSTNTSQYIRFSSGTNSTVSIGGDVTATNNGSAASTNGIYFGHTGILNVGGNLTLNSNGGSGIFFGANSGTTNQANGKTINTGVFSGGNLSLLRFVQAGPTLGNTSTLDLTGPTTQSITMGIVTFFDNVTGAGPNISCYTGTYNGNATLTKKGGNNHNTWAGGNVFNGTTIITNLATGLNLAMANSTADDYNGDVTFVQSGTGVLYPNYNTTCTYSGNITVTSPGATAITFGSGGSGVAKMDGGNAQTINKTAGSAVPNFTRLTMEKSADEVTLNTRINITALLTMTSGIMNTTAVNVLHMNNNTTTTIGNAISYVDGPMEYDMALNGTRTLNFPLGDDVDWRPAQLTLTHNSGTNFTYTSEVFNYNANLFGYTMPAGITYVSYMHYWQLDRSATTNLTAASATLYYGANDGVTDPAELRMVKTIGTGTVWNNIGGTGTAVGTGSITSSVNFTTFSKFTLANTLAGINPLPIELLAFEAKICDGKEVCLDWTTASEINNDFFTLERSNDGIHFEPIGTVDGAGNSSALLAYQFTDQHPLSGTSYYRLKQTDFNGDYTYSDIRSVSFSAEGSLSVFPNPFVSTITIASEEVLQNGNYSIYDLQGKLEYTFNPSASGGNSLQIDLSELVPGVYILETAKGEKIRIIRQ